MIWPFNSAQRTLNKVQEILGLAGGGVHKRIEENRVLLQLLQHEAPDFLTRNIWVEGWLVSNHHLFSDLAKAVPTERRKSPRPPANEMRPDAILAEPHRA